MRGLCNAQFDRSVLILLVLTLVVAAGGPVGAQVADDADLMDRPISEVEIQGLDRVREQEVRNNIRAAVGSPYDPNTIRGDVRRLEALGQFKYVDVIAELKDDGTVRLLYSMTEKPLVHEVQVVDNKLISDQELLAAVPLRRGGPRDDFLIKQAKRNIEALYRNRGHYLTTVVVDESELEESGLLLFRVIEGPRVKVRAIELEGNDAFADKRLRAEIESKTAFPIFRKGALDEDLLDQDVAAIDTYYKDRGYLDVRVDHRIELSPDNREAKIVFLIVEGPQYTLGRVRAEQSPTGEPLEVFSPQQLQALMTIRPGDVYSQDKLRESIKRIREAYGLMGYVRRDPQRGGYGPVEVNTFELRRGEEPVVDVILEIDEGQFAMLGLIKVQGNFLTKQKIILRETELKPNRPLDATELERTKARLRDTRLFGRPLRLTIQDPPSPDSNHHDVLIEVREQNTGSVGFGVAVGSDSGLFGEISVDQRNFDIADLPESFEEFIRGRSFRGAGQRFQMVFRPGNEIFQYSLSVTEPNFLETDYSLSVGGTFFRRIFRMYDEQRVSGNLGIGRELGDIWSAGLDARIERVELSDIDFDAPTEIFRDSGPDTITGVSLSLTRSTVTTIRRPGDGSRLRLSYERVGALGGAFDFNKIQGEYTMFLTVDRDFLGRKSTLRLNTKAGYIFGGDRPPTYEQFYLGGRSLRGFDFREVSPKGIRADTGDPSDEPVGGEFMFFAGAQYERPLIEEQVTGVLFVDSGTVLDEVGLSEYRVSLGAGIRLYIEQFGPVPIALDFAVPVRSEDGDDEEIFSFSAEIPF